MGGGPGSRCPGWPWAPPRHLPLLPQGHLARFLAFGLRLSVTAVEGDARLVAQAAKFDRALALELEKEQARRQVSGAEGRQLLALPRRQLS